MITEYIQEAMKLAKYKILEDGSYYGEITQLSGVWADGLTLEECSKVLSEVLEEWILLKLRDNEDIPSLGGISLARKSLSV